MLLSMCQFTECLEKEDKRRTADECKAERKKGHAEDHMHVAHKTMTGESCWGKVTVQATPLHFRAVSWPARFSMNVLRGKSLSTQHFFRETTPRFTFTLKT